MNFRRLTLVGCAPHGRGTIGLNNVDSFRLYRPPQRSPWTRNLGNLQGLPAGLHGFHRNRLHRAAVRGRIRSLAFSGRGIGFFLDREEVP